MRNLFFASIFLVVLIAVSAHADDIFQLAADSSTTTVKAGGSSLIGLVDHLSNNTQQFAPLKNQAFNANLNYAGINNAFVFHQSFDAGATG